VQKSFIAVAQGPSGIVVGAGNIYRANYDNGTIGRARLGGTRVRQDFIVARVNLPGTPDAATPDYLAIGP
jgi:hypothetical protein